MKVLSQVDNLRSQPCYLYFLVVLSIFFPNIIYADVEALPYPASDGEKLYEDPYLTLSGPSGGVVYQDSDLIMGYIQPGQTQNVSGYNECYYSIGRWLAMHHSAAPNFEVKNASGSIQISKDTDSNGYGAFVCYNSTNGVLKNKKFVYGTALPNTNIGTNLSCIMSIGWVHFINLSIDRSAISCKYDYHTGQITVKGTGNTRLTYDDPSFKDCYTCSDTTSSLLRCKRPPTPCYPNLTTVCNYICLDQNVNNIYSKVKSYNYKEYGYITLPKKQNCAKGINRLWTDTTGIITFAYYNRVTGQASKGGGEYGGNETYSSYFCGSTPSFPERIE